MNASFHVSRLGLSALGFLSLAIFAGCNIVPPPQADATRYYVLSSPVAATGETAPAHGALRIGLKPVEVAPYLRKGVIAVRRGENELVFDDYSRWAEPLEAGIARVVRARLLADARFARVFMTPFPVDEERNFDVSIGIVRCEGDCPASGGATARFVATIEISSVGAGAEMVARRTFAAPAVAWDGRNRAALAAALSDAVNALGQELAAALKQFSSERR